MLIHLQQELKSETSSSKFHCNYLCFQFIENFCNFKFFFSRIHSFVFIKQYIFYSISEYKEFEILHHSFIISNLKENHIRSCTIQFD